MPSRDFLPMNAAIRIVATSVVALLVVAAGFYLYGRLRPPPAASVDVSDLDVDVAQRPSPPPSDAPASAPAGQAPPPSMVRSTPFPATPSAHYPGQVDPSQLTSPLTVRTPPAPGVNYFVSLERDDTNSTFVQLYLGPAQSVDMGIVPGRYRVIVSSGFEWYGEQLLFGGEASFVVMRDLLVAAPHRRSTLDVTPVPGAAPRNAMPRPAQIPNPLRR